MEWGLRETWYAPEIWLACFLLATTVTSGEDLTATGESWKGGSRTVNFDNIYESCFLPALWRLDLNGTFVWEDGEGLFLFLQCLSWHSLG